MSATKKPTDAELDAFLAPVEDEAEPEAENEAEDEVDQQSAREKNAIIVADFDLWRAGPNPTPQAVAAVATGPAGTFIEWAKYFAAKNPEGTADWVIEQAGVFEFFGYHHDPVFQRARQAIPPEPLDRNSAEHRTWQSMLTRFANEELKNAKQRTDNRPLITTLEDLLREEYDTDEMLVPDLDIAADTLFQTLGVKESFKTFGILNLGTAAAHGGKFLGCDVMRLPFVYVSGEKRRRSIQNRLGLISRHYRKNEREEILVVHRAGLRIHPDDEQWKRLVDAIASRKRRMLVGLDTITSLAPRGFKEISGESWAEVLDAIRMLTDLPEPATVFGSFHPAKDDKGGIKTESRGHTSFGGEADGALAFTRPSRQTNDAIIHVIPKDGAYRRLPVWFDPDTFLLVRKDLTGLPLSHDSVLTVLATNGPCDIDTVREAYGKEPGSDKWRFGVPKVREVLDKAVDAGAATKERGDASKAFLYSTPPPTEQEDE